MTEPEQPTEEVRTAAADLLEQCKLANVRPAKIMAEFLGPLSAPIATVQYKPTLEFSVGLGRFSNRFGYELDLRDDSDEAVALINFTLVVDWAVPHDYEPELEAADFVAGTTGYFAAYPYAREMVQNLGTRLGLDPVVLGTLARGRLGPESVTIVTFSDDSGRADIKVLGTSGE